MLKAVEPSKKSSVEAGKDIPIQSVSLDIWDKR